MNFFKKIFGGSVEKSGAEGIIEETLSGIIDNAKLELSFDIKEEEKNTYQIELYGEDEELLRDRDGQLLDAFQFFLTRVLQHRHPDDKIFVRFDSNGYREESNQALEELADRLMKVVIDKKKPVFCRALPPKDRKVVHQYLSNDTRVSSRSIGEGHYKKIKISLAGDKGSNYRGDRGDRGDRNNQNERGNRHHRGRRNSNNNRNQNRSGNETQGQQSDDNYNR
jgi:spoIIIJ-associated protein